jgi:ABC-type lipoprotein export system ATPase subunit
MFARTPRAIRDERITKLAEAVGITDRLSHLPRELSGGQMQRVAIARALVNQPKILLADEPTGNLDSANSQGIMELFRKVRQDFGTTVVVITHDAKIADVVDRTITMHDGEIA